MVTTCRILDDLSRVFVKFHAYLFSLDRMSGLMFSWYLVDEAAHEKRTKTRCA